MKKTNTILIILALVVWVLFFSNRLWAQIDMDSLIVVDTWENGTIANGTIHSIYPTEQSEKQLEFNLTAPALLLLNLYLYEVNQTEVHIGWRLILHEEGNSNISREIFFSKAIDYLQPYEYDHGAFKSIFYGVDESKHIDNYSNYLAKWFEIKSYVRAEKIMRSKKPSFEDFIDWTQEYFKEQLK